MRGHRQAIQEKGGRSAPQPESISQTLSSFHQSAHRQKHTRTMDYCQKHTNVHYSFPSFCIDINDLCSATFHAQSSSPVPCGTFQQSPVNDYQLLCRYLYSRTFLSTGEWKQTELLHVTEQQCADCIRIAASHRLQVKLRCTAAILTVCPLGAPLLLILGRREEAGNYVLARVS